MQIKTTGELRGFLLEAMMDLKAGKIEVSTANTLQKMAAQVNESLYAELKAVALLKEASAEEKFPIGQRPITDLKLIEGGKKNAG